jgi:uncharacterized repeat protein (TIGR03803 family)
LILSGNTLYGTANGGGSSGDGTLFAVNTNGTGFTNLHSFNENLISDGNGPGDLVLSGNTLYGTAAGGGGSANGTVFKLKTDGTGFTNLHSFAGGSDGGNPYAGLIVSATPCMDDRVWRHFGRWHSVRDQCRWHGHKPYGFPGGSDGGFPAADLFYPATPYGTESEARGLWLARCSPSPMARVLPICIVSLASTELIRKPG